MNTHVAELVNAIHIGWRYGVKNRNAGSSPAVGTKYTIIVFIAK